MKKALVVGATGTIGSAIVQSLQTRDYSIQEEWNSKTRPDLSEENAFDEISSDLEVAIYAAGINVISPVEEMSISEWREVLDINLTAAFRFSKAIIKNLGGRKTKIVFISSIMAMHPYPNRAAYSASKVALESLTRSLAVESRGRYSAMTIRLGHINKLMATTNTALELLPAVKLSTPDNNLTSPREVGELIADLIPHVPLLNGSILEADRGYSINIWPLSKF
jgi:3-oxoacyl-[acyl-carrier protein] reductase